MRIISLLMLLTISNVIFSAPRSVYWAFWDKSNDANVTVINHVEWGQFLSKYLNQNSEGITEVDYAGVSEEDKQKLSNYIDQMQEIPILSYSKDEQRAYWINLYNAATVQLILNNYPVSSIRNIPNAILRHGPWDLKILEVEGQAISLNDIEHRILRPIWEDPRVHFVVNCASIGCPNLAMTAFTATNYETLATALTKDHVNNYRGVYLRGNTIVLTSLLDWYGEDFGRNITERIAFLMKYANPDTQQMLQDWQEKRISYEYNWNLNEKN